MTRSTLANAGHVQEGKNRFAKADPEDTLFMSAEAQKALNKLHHDLEFFPTPPWAVRALIHMLPREAHNWANLPLFDEAGHARILEPAAGRGHIVVPLEELGYQVDASDIHDHGKGYPVDDFLKVPIGMVEDWTAVITNPPFSLAADFALKGLESAPDVFLLCRLSFLCSGKRHALHTQHLKAVYPFCERVCMALGKYDPAAKFATETAWFHFSRDADPCSHPAVIHIPPGMRERFFRRDDLLI